MPAAVGEGNRDTFIPLVEKYYTGDYLIIIRLPR